MRNRVIAALILSFMGISSFFFFVLAVFIRLVTAPFDHRRVWLHRFTCLWASLYTWLVPAWQVRVENRHRIDKTRTYVIVSNHQSGLDILVAFRLFCHFKWVSKIEMFRVPLIGWNMWLNGYIPLRRGQRDSVVQMMQTCERALAAGNSIYFFPEGTRSRDGRLRPFKTGAFILAKKMGVALLPVIINGTSKALPKNSLNFHGHFPMRVTVLPHIEVNQFAHLSAEQTAQMVRDRMRVHVDAHKNDDAG